MASSGVESQPQQKTRLLDASIPHDESPPTPTSRNTVLDLLLGRSRWWAPPQQRMRPAAESLRKPQAWSLLKASLLKLAKEAGRLEYRRLAGSSTSLPLVPQQYAWPSRAEDGMYRRAQAAWEASLLCHCTRLYTDRNRGLPVSCWMLLGSGLMPELGCPQICSE